MRAVRSATWTSGEPVSPFARWLSAMTFALSATVTAMSVLGSLGIYRLLGKRAIIARKVPAFPVDSRPREGLRKRAPRARDTVGNFGDAEQDLRLVRGND